MPQFEIDLGAAIKDWRELDSFTQGYIEAAFFTDTGTGDDRENGLENACFDEIAPESLAKVIADCAAFQAQHAALLDSVYGVTGKYEKAPYDENRAGSDYWYTRNGHGTGFWDRGLGDVADQLANVCRYREVNLVRGDDGQIYFE